MKNLINLMLIAIVLVSCKKVGNQLPPWSCKGNMQVNQQPLKDSIDKIIQKYVTAGIPGIQVAVKTAKGMLITQAGYADPVKKTSIEPCMGSWLFSLTKAYTASLIMKQQEAGKLDIDQVISNYLPSHITVKIKGSEKITLRMLLNHSSGLIDFISLPEYLNIQFTDPASQPSNNDLVNMMSDRELLYQPGTDFFYSNTNYLLLQIILEKVAGKDYATLLNEFIIQPLRLQQTWFHPSQDQIKTLGFPHYNFDPNGSGTAVDATAWNNYLGFASNGWGGIAATASDAILFYEALMENRVVKPASLKEMTTWFQGKNSSQPDYGLGIEYFQYTGSKQPQPGHEGDGIGNTTMILYSPGNKTFLFINILVGRKLGGPFLDQTINCKNQLATLVSNWKQ